ncbi:hypothetical protein LTR27_002771 [Elasticomyces elasticus]|nr:hypothetical protein LTR27_002771 [Elasticomyces elasticus]
MPGFLRLPPELRNQIYEYTMPKTTVYFKATNEMYSCWDGPQALLDTIYGSAAPVCKRPEVHVLLHTCRTTRFEALPLYFGRVILVLDMRPGNAATMVKWLRCGSSLSLSKLRGVILADDLMCERANGSGRKHLVVAEIGFLSDPPTVRIRERTGNIMVQNNAHLFDQRAIWIAEKQVKQGVAQMQTFARLKATKTLTQDEQKAAFLAIFTKVPDATDYIKYIVTGLACLGVVFLCELLVLVVATPIIRAIGRMAQPRITRIYTSMASFTWQPPSNSNPALKTSIFTDVETMIHNLFPGSAEALVNRILTAPEYATLRAIFHLIVLLVDVAYRLGLLRI